LWCKGCPCVGEGVGWAPHLSPQKTLKNLVINGHKNAIKHKNMRRPWIIDIFK
jgi:hypothetical protein